MATVLGASGTAILVVGMEYAAEITYPMPEATSSGMLNCAAQVRWRCPCRGGTPSTTSNPVTNPIVRVHGCWCGCCHQIYGAVLIAVMTKLEETPLGHELGNWVLCGMLCLGLACLIPMKPSMRRTMAENNRGNPLLQLPRLSPVQAVGHSLTNGSPCHQQVTPASAETRAGAVAAAAGSAAAAVVVVVVVTSVMVLACWPRMGSFCEHPTLRR